MGAALRLRVDFCKAMRHLVVLSGQPLAGAITPKGGA
jgi:hypothetical protein